MQYQEAYNRLEQYGQTHLLRYYDTLSAAEQAALLQQISEMDFSVLERAAHEEAPKGKIEPLGACTISEIAERFGAGESRIKSILYRMRRELRKHLQKEGIAL